MSSFGIAVAAPGQSTAERYEALIRIANSIRAQKNPRELFGMLVHDLGRVIQFDAIPQFEGAGTNGDWHAGATCGNPNYPPPAVEGKGTPAGRGSRNQEVLAAGSLEAEPRCPASTG